jgi:hypothetical protein
MEGTDPLHDPQPDEHIPEVVDTPPLEVHSPNVPPIEYLDTRDTRVIAILTFFSTLWVKVLIGVAAALVVGGTVWHFAHHRKPMMPPVKHVQAVRVTPKPVAAPHKHAAAKSHSHKTAKKSAKKKSPSHSDSSAPKRQPRPWFSSRESNG